MGSGGLLGGLLGAVLGGGEKPKAPQIIQPTSDATSTTKSAAEIAAVEEDERRKRLLALNAGGSQGQLTGAAGDTSQAPVSRKTLFGQ